MQLHASIVMVVSGQLWRVPLPLMIASVAWKELTPPCLEQAVSAFVLIAVLAHGRLYVVRRAALIAAGVLSRQFLARRPMPVAKVAWKAPFLQAAHRLALIVYLGHGLMFLTPKSVNAAISVRTPLSVDLHHPQVVLNALQEHGRPHWALLLQAVVFPVLKAHGPIQLEGMGLMSAISVILERGQLNLEPFLLQVASVV